MATLNQKFIAVEKQLQDAFIERHNEARGLTLAALSGNHIFFVGPAGTAKSAMIKWYCDRFGASYFTWLLTRFSTPDELFGPVDITAMKNGSYRRITKGKLPESQVAFLDEIFKANSAINNSMLSVLNERIYHNDGAPVKIPLIFAAAASNEIPDDDESLGALYDRFLIRFNVEYIRERQNFLKLLLDHNAVNGAGADNITIDELNEARDQTKMVKLTHSFIEAYADLREALKAENIKVSDRRFVQALGVFKANAWLDGRRECDVSDLAAGGNLFWDKPADAKKVMGICLKISDPNLFKAQRLYEAADDAAKIIIEAGATGKDNTENAIKVTAQLKKIIAEIEGMAGKSARISDMANKVRDMNKEVMRKGLGLNV